MQNNHWWIIQAADGQWLVRCKLCAMDPFTVAAFPTKEQALAMLDKVRASR